MGNYLQFKHDSSLLKNAEKFFKVILGCFLIQIFNLYMGAWQGTFSVSYIQHASDHQKCLYTNSDLEWSGTKYLLYSSSI
ncbi:hypothetical protein Belba_3779 [Belliella baltica DSM 15883]|uniref:Uncharacterized protein n=1 Tax=Belliella baltica (strain DSM 15883 / CIP 108006 / LMG 21964 / BA134) TaxID=866536 RepID=I3ZAJ4_BELBD|nr:hypothetical protein Belba_3779 [Belliella baltica DSM 15883]